MHSARSPRHAYTGSLSGEDGRYVPLQLESSRAGVAQELLGGLECSGFAFVVFSTKAARERALWRLGSLQAEIGDDELDEEEEEQPDPPSFRGKHPLEATRTSSEPRSTLFGNFGMPDSARTLWTFGGVLMVLAAIPVLASGVVIISGVLGTGTYGTDPVRGSLLGVGTGVAYAGFLLALRQANVGNVRPAGALRDATALGAVGTAVVAVAQGQAAALVPSWPSAGWLLALAVGSQVVAWLLITASLPRLPAALTSVVLTLQPVGSMLLGAGLLGERPTPVQLVGVALVVLALLHATGATARRRVARPEPSVAVT